MTADWKKKPLDRAKPRDDLKALRAQVKALEDKLARAKYEVKYYAQKCEQIAGNWNAASKAANRYDALRMKGVLIDHDGEFKFLQGKDLDAFFEGPGFANRIINESMMRQIMANVISTPPGVTLTGWVKDGNADWTKFEWTASAEL